jgi:hypothetical protein
LTLSQLLGLTKETVDVAEPLIPQIGQLLLSNRYYSLASSVSTLGNLMRHSRGSELTQLIKDEDVRVENFFSEVKQTVKLATKSSVPDKKAAAMLLMPVIKPFWDITHDYLASQSAELEVLIARIENNKDYPAALGVLGLDSVWTSLVAANVALNLLYDRRLSDNADEAAPSASSVKATVVKDYENFCIATEQVVEVFPSAPVEKLFNEMNALRIKYA